MVFHRKDLCEAKPKMQSVFKFSDVLFALKSDGGPTDVALDQVDIFLRSLDQADLWSDVPPIVASSAQEWYYFRAAWHLVSLCIRLIFGQMYPLVEATSGQDWYYLRSAWHFVSLWVWLTFGQITLVDTSSGQDWYYLRSTWHLDSLWVRLTFGQMYPLPPWRPLMTKFGTTLNILFFAWMNPAPTPAPAPCPTPGRDILWPSLVLLWSDVPHPQ